MPVQKNKISCLWKNFFMFLLLFTNFGALSDASNTKTSLLNIPNIRLLIIFDRFSKVIKTTETSIGVLKNNDLNLNIHQQDVSGAYIWGIKGVSTPKKF